MVKGGSPVFHKQMADKCPICRIGMFTPEAGWVERLPSTFEIPLSSARATPPCPGSRAFFWSGYMAKP